MTAEAKGPRDRRIPIHEVGQLCLSVHWFAMLIAQRCDQEANLKLILDGPESASHCGKRNSCISSQFPLCQRANLEGEGFAVVGSWTSLIRLFVVRRHGRPLGIFKHFRPMTFIRRAARLQWSSDPTLHELDCSWVINHVAGFVLVPKR